MLENLKSLITKLQTVKSIAQKVQILEEENYIKKFLGSHENINSISKSLTIEHDYIIKALIAIKQADNIFYNLEKTKNHEDLLKTLCKTLLEIDEFFSPIGGIIGYHYKFLSLLKNGAKKNVTFSEPYYLDISKKDDNIDQLIQLGLKNLDKFALICPMGGAGDRLNLYDEKTKKPLPAAKLNFLGRTLVELIIRDLQALEYLYFKTFNKEIITPVVIMTSEEKDNHKHILSIFEANNWFNRDKKSFYFIKQILAPVITQEGNWALLSPLKLALKPSGHGMIWHLMHKTKAFDFLHHHKREKALIRQINNPIAGTDYLFLALMGFAIKENKSFGFVSCPREIGFKEGINVLKEIKKTNGLYYNISNIEYTDFKKYNIQDAPLSDDSHFSKYPSNTNILLADLKEVKKASINDPFPGLTINLKTKVFSKNHKGQILPTKAGRLESMMQNIADSIQDFSEKPLDKKDQKNLKTFLILNKREKTISTTKKTFIEGESSSETPPKCFYDILVNYHDLLSNYCNMQMPKMPSLKEYFFKGPAFLCSFHPMLGPLYEIIANKIKNGKMIQGSELHLEIAEILFENLYLDGSLIVETPLINTKKPIYNSSSCILNNVKIKNLGIDTNYNNIYWENKIKRKEYLKINLGENSHLYASNVEFINTHEITVPSFHKMFIIRKNEKIIYKTEKI